MQIDTSDRNTCLILVRVSACSNLLLHATVAKMCLNKAIDNKQQKRGELICGVSSLIFWYESRIRALARMDFKPTRRPGPRSVPPTNLYTSNTSDFKFE
jgi:hypothetical protein